MNASGFTSQGGRGECCATPRRRLDCGRVRRLLRPSREGTAAEAPEEARGEEAQDVLLAHRRLLREPQRFLAWLPVYDADDEELLDLVRDSDAAGGQT